jgi:soluble lytic murein transglycosylase-like protein
MKTIAFLLLLPALLGTASCQSRRVESEYYVRAYALHYRLPLDFVRALVEEESGWHTCARSPRGAVGLMQLMPETARLLRVDDPCDPGQNVSAGVRYLAYLFSVFHGDLRLIAAAYQAGEGRIAARGLNYANPQVVAYVERIRKRVRAVRLLQPEKEKGGQQCY